MKHRTSPRPRLWSVLLALSVLGGAGSAQAPPTGPPPPPAPGAPEKAAEGGLAAPPAKAAGEASALPAVSRETEIQVSFSGANVDVVVKWLAEMTGKSIVKHKGVACQLTIVSSKKLPPREAIHLVYRALALEGFSAIETADSVILVPEAMEAKIGAELVEGSKDGLLEGRQVLVKVFQLQHAQASKLKDKVRGVLSEKAKLEVDDHANKIIVTDFADNVRLLGELIRELDVTTIADSVIEIFPLKHAEAEDLARILAMVFAEAGARAPGPPAGGGPPPPGAPPPPPGAPSAGGESVRLLADKTANRLIVTASRKKMPEIRTLIEVLDTAKPADLAVRVIPLEHASAKDLVQEIGPMYQKVRGGSLKEIVEITANSRSNSLIVLSSEANFQAIQRLVAALDTKEAQEKVLRAFSLKNADAEDVASQLEKLHQGRDDDGYGYFYYYRRSQAPSGQVRFVADRRRNTVVAIGPPGSLEGVAEMIKALDEPVEGENLVPQIYSLKFVSAVDVELVLDELFVKRRQRRSYWDYEFGYEEKDRDIGRLYGKVRFASEPYTNSLIVTANSQETLDAVESVLRKLDVPSTAGDTTMNVGLKFASAVLLANNINILYAQSGAPPRRQAQQEPRAAAGRQQSQPGQPTSSGFELEEEVQEESYFPWLGGQQEGGRTFDGRTTVRPVSDLVGRVRVVPDLRTNSLLITTNAHFFPQVLKVVSEMDVPTAQVLIEAKIVEVGSDFRERMGVRWSPDGTRVFDAEDFDNSVIVEGNAVYKEIFAGSAVADSLRTGILDASVSLDLLIQFLRKRSDSRVRAEPRINVADNERGQLFVGAQVPFILNSQLTPEGSRNDSFTYKDVGIILEVTPHINNTRDVALTIRVEASTIRSGQTLFGGAIIDTRNYRTDLLVKSGQTLVLGGIIQKQDELVERRVPVLSYIPILGWLFRKRDTVTRDVELMVFLRPTVTQSPEEAESLMREEAQKTPQIQEWEKALEQE